MSDWPREKGWDIDPAREYTITLTQEQLTTIHWALQSAVDGLRAKVLWHRDFCSDKRVGAETAAQYEGGIVKAEGAMAAILAVLIEE